MNLKSKFNAFSKKLVDYYKENKKKALILAGMFLVLLIIGSTFLVLRNRGTEDDAIKSQKVTLTSGNFSKTIDVVGSVNGIQ